MNKRRQPFVFPTDSETVRIRTQMPINVEHDASRKYQEFSRCYVNDEYSYESHQFISNICRSVTHHPLLQGFPVRDTLITVSKKLLLNQLQFLFLSCLLDELKWPILDETIKNHATTLKSLEPGTSQQLELKCMELYLLLAAYSVKVYLNEDIKIFEGEMNDLLPKFQQIFQTWGTKFARTALIINPKKLNSKFNEFSTKHDEKVVHHEDLNSKVNQLLQNAPSLDGPRRTRKYNNQFDGCNEKTPQQSYSNQKHFQQDFEQIPPQIPLQSQLSFQQQKMINQMPPAPWPSTGDSYYGNSFLRQNSLDIWGFAQNSPGLLRFDSNGSEYNLGNLNALKSQVSFNDRQQPQP